MVARTEPRRFIEPYQESRPLAGLSDTMLRQIDASRTLAFAAETNERFSALADDIFNLPTAQEAVSRAQDGWEVSPFPGHPASVAVKSEHGWGCQPSGATFEDQWARLPASRRRNALRTMMIERSMVFASLGHWAQALLGLSSPGLHRGVWQVLEKNLSPQEYETTQFLYGLGGSQAVRPVI